MDLMPTPDQEQIGASVRAFLGAELPMEKVRALADDPAGIAPTWAAAGELGYFGLGLPLERDGAGYGLTEEMVLFEELGRALAPGPWLGTIVAAHALADQGDDRLRAALADVVAGRLRVALVEGLDRPLARALRDGRLEGRRAPVADAAAAQAFLVVDESGAAFVPAGAAGVAIEPRASMDPTRPVARVAFGGSPAVRLAADPRRILLAATVLSCAEAVGGIQRTVEASVEYAKVRTQFDKPIGSFQAVKHRCADMAARAEAARSATAYATVALRDSAPDAAFQVSVAKVLCAQAYVANSADNVQNHGGMGFTWECDAHLFVKRARSFEATLGSRAAHLDRLVEGFRAA
jgi:alkylation response protein AidB-like acyl-CoA dehydrogenase